VSDREGFSSKIFDFMASLASSGVTILDSWTEGGNNGKKLNVYKCSVVLSSMGTVANGIPATAFRLSTIERVSPWTLSDNTIVLVAAPNVLKTAVLLKAAGTNAPADYSGTYECTVWGYPPQA
jgi:hypothetical protein